MNVSIIIPAYNEEDNIEELLHELIADYDYEIIVVDDGSTDNTVVKVSAFPGIKLLRHPYNIGNGASVRRGIEAASGDVVVCMDADGQHASAEIPKLLEFIPEYDMVIGSRRMNHNVSSFRTFGNSGLKLMAEFLSGHKIDDLTSGFRAMKKNMISDYLHIFPNRYSYPTTSVMAFLCSAKTIKYVRLDSIGKRKNGRSNIQPFRDGFRFINVMLRIIMLFHPQKVFVPISLVLFILGIIMGVRSLIFFHKIVQSSAILLVASISIFLFGLLAEQISCLVRRTHDPKSDSLL